MRITAIACRSSRSPTGSGGDDTSDFVRCRSAIRAAARRTVLAEPCVPPFFHLTPNLFGGRPFPRPFCFRGRPTPTRAAREAETEDGESQETRRRGKQRTTTDASSLGRRPRPPPLQPPTPHPPLQPQTPPLRCGRRLRPLRCRHHIRRYRQSRATSLLRWRNLSRWRRVVATPLRQPIVARLRRRRIVGDALPPLRQRLPSTAATRERRGDSPGREPVRHRGANLSGGRVVKHAPSPRPRRFVLRLLVRGAISPLPQLRHGGVAVIVPRRRGVWLPPCTAPWHGAPGKGDHDAGGVGAEHSKVASAWEEKREKKGECRVMQSVTKKREREAHRGGVSLDVMAATRAERRAPEDRLRAALPRRLRAAGQGSSPGDPAAPTSLMPMGIVLAVAMVPSCRSGEVGGRG